MKLCEIFYRTVDMNDKKDVVAFDVEGKISKPLIISMAKRYKGSCEEIKTTVPKCKRYKFMFDEQSDMGDFIKYFEIMSKNKGFKIKR